MISRFCCNYHRSREVVRDDTPFGLGLWSYMLDAWSKARRMGFSSTNPPWGFRNRHSKWWNTGCFASELPSSWWTRYSLELACGHICWAHGRGVSAWVLVYARRITNGPVDIHLCVCVIPCGEIKESIQILRRFRPILCGSLPGVGRGLHQSWYQILILVCILWIEGAREKEEVWYAQSGIRAWYFVFIFQVEGIEENTLIRTIKWYQST